MPWLSLGDWKSNRTAHLITLVLTALAMSVSLHLTYLPWWCGDSITYSGPAHAMARGTFASFPTARTPGYPIFLFYCQWLSDGDTHRLLTPHAAQVVTWVQSGLMIVSVALTYLTMLRLQIRPAIAFALSLFVALAGGVALAQMMIMSETLSLFFLVLATYLVGVAVDCFRRGASPNSMALIAGLSFGAAILVRPNLIFVWSVFIAVIPVFVPWRWMRNRRFKSGGALLKITLPSFASATVLLLIWLFINYEKTGVISLTLMSEAVRTSAVYNLFDQVHPQDKILGDIMVKYYQQTNHDDIVDRSYIFTALPELEANDSRLPLQNSNGKPPWVNLYLYIGSVSKNLMLEHPRSWLANGLSDLPLTFDFNFPQTIPNERVDPVSVTGTPVVVNLTGWEIHRQVAAVESWLILALDLLTFASVLVGVRKALAAADLPSALVPLTIAALAIGSILCMFAPCFLADYNDRYSIPLVPLFALCAGYVLEKAMMRPSFQ